MGPSTPIHVSNACDPAHLNIAGQTINMILVYHEDVDSRYLLPHLRQTNIHS